MSATDANPANVPDGWVLRLLLGATLGLAAVLFAQSRRREGHAGVLVRAKAIDLLDVPIVGALLRWRHFNTLLVAPTLVVFALIVAAGLFGEQTTDNPAVLLTWIVWWPAVIFTFFLVGRIWCTVCPFGVVGDLAQRVLTFGRKAPGVLRNMWWRLGTFLLLTWLTALFALDRGARSTAWLALALTIGAVALAIVYEKRVFCRYVCPVGGIFGLYSMTAPLALSARSADVCRTSCRTKDCAASCAWFLFPANLDRGSECSLCLDCVRACPHDNLALRPQAVGSALARFKNPRRSLDEAATVAAVLGVAVVQTIVMLEVWPAWQAAMGAAVHLVPGPLLYTLVYLTFGVVVPFALVGTVAYLTTRGDERRPTAAGALRTYAYAFLPLGLGLHAAHNFHHLLGEGGAVLSVFGSLTGHMATAVATPATIGPNWIFFFQWLTLAGGLYLAWQVSTGLASREAPDSARAIRFARPIQLFAVAYTLMNVLVLAAPMAHRH